MSKQTDEEDEIEMIEVNDEENEKEIKFLTIKEMTYYAADKYSNVASQVPFPDNQSHSCAAYCMIEKTLRKHKLIPPKKSKSGANAASKESRSGVNSVSERIAHFVIDEILFDKFANEYEKNDMQRKIEKQEERYMERLKEQSREMDRRLSEEERETDAYLSEIENPAYDGKNAKELLQEYTLISKNYDEDGIHKSNYSYHLPKDNELSTERIDQAVDRMMLRALFDHFFYFNETRFRRNFIERLKLIQPDNSMAYGEGYHELTKQLENPIGNYVFPYNKPTKKLAIKVSPETAKRIRAYASKNHITVEKAIDDWIWSQTLKSDKKENK